MTSVFVFITWAWPCAGSGGSVTPANSGLLVVTLLKPPLGTHHVLSPVFMLYAVIPPNCFGLRIDTPPILANASRSENPSSLSPACRTYPAGVGSAPINPQLSWRELRTNSEHGSFCRLMVLRPVIDAT